MSVDITAHIIAENLNDKEKKYSYVGHFNANFLHNHLDIAFDWQDEASEELTEAFWSFQEEKYQILGLFVLTTKKLQDYIDDIESDIAQIKFDRENDYYIVHTSKSRNAVERAMKRIAWTKGAIESRRKDIAEVNYYKVGLEFISVLLANYDYDFSEKCSKRTQEIHCLLEYR